MSTSRDLHALAAHEKFPGKLETTPREPLTAENLPLLYTPGVAAVSRHLAEHPHDLGKYSLQGNLVAVISDGSAVLGLGNTGPQGAYPVMEGKAMLFKALGGVDAIPIVLSTQDPDEIVTAILAIAPSFAGINLEDIAAPKCYDIEKRLREALTIPVMHDDQHATAMVVLAGLINAAKVTGRDLRHSKIVVVGAGAAGGAVVRLLHAYGAVNLLVVDSQGIITSNREKLDPNKAELAALSNPANEEGSLDIAMKGADIVVGLAHAALITPEQVKSMTARPIVFALSNPEPEITPAAALKAGAAVVATGSSEHPNQINNVLVFPGVFRGALDHHVRTITTAHMLSVATLLADLIEAPTADRIIPSVFDARVVPAVASAFESQ